MTIDVLGVGLELPYDLTAADDAEKWEQDLARLNQTPAGNRRKRKPFTEPGYPRADRRDGKMAGRSVWPGIRRKGI